MELVALKVKIGLRVRNGRREAGYPDFNRIPVALRGQMDWSQYIDSYGSGWLYDKKCGHQDEDETSPRGQQWGVILVPEDFALEAEALFPEDCQVLEEHEAEEFYNSRCAYAEQEYEIDKDALDSLKLLEEYEAAGVLPPPSEEEVARRNKMKDPNDDTPGLRLNMRKSFSRMKTRKKVSIKVPSIKKDGTPRARRPKA